MARAPEIAADVTAAATSCYACQASIHEATVVFLRPLRESQTIDTPYSAAVTICRGCFEHEMARRIEEMRG